MVEGSGRIIYLKVVVFFLLLASASSMVYAMKNPAQVYCEALGYKYVIKQTSEGDEGVCVFGDGVSCEAWGFLKGVCGQDYSYCKKKGYGIKTVSDWDRCLSVSNTECSFCVLDDGREVEVTVLMGLDFSEGVCGDGLCVLGENYGRCPQDCPSGSLDGLCDSISDGVCDLDCDFRGDVDCAGASTTLTTVEEHVTSTFVSTSTSSTSTIYIPEETSSTVYVSTTSTEGVVVEKEEGTSTTLTGVPGSGAVDYLQYFFGVVVFLFVFGLLYFLYKRGEEKRIERQREEFIKWKREHGGV